MPLPPYCSVGSGERRPAAFPCFRGGDPLSEAAARMFQGTEANAYPRSPVEGVISKYLPSSFSRHLTVFESASERCMFRVVQFIFVSVVKASGEVLCGLSKTFFRCNYYIVIYGRKKNGRLNSLLDDEVSETHQTVKKNMTYHEF